MFDSHIIFPCESEYDKYIREFTYERSIGVTGPQGDIGPHGSMENFNLIELVIDKIIEIQHFIHLITTFYTIS